MIISVSSFPFQSEKCQNLPSNNYERTRQIIQLIHLKDEMESDDEVAFVDSYIGSEHSFSSDYDSYSEIGIGDRSSNSRHSDCGDDESPQVATAAEHPSVCCGEKLVFFSWNCEAAHIRAKI